MLEVVLRDEKFALSSNPFKDIREYAEEEYLGYCLRKTLYLRPLHNTTEIDRFAAILCQYAQTHTTFHHRSGVYLILGIWKRLQNQSIAARKVLQPHIKLAIDMLLTGDVDQTDLGPWWSIIDSLLASGDFINALAGISFIRQSRVPSKSKPINFIAGGILKKVEEIIHKNADKENLVECPPELITTSRLTTSRFRCNGCSGPIYCQKTHHRCTYCVGVDLCEDCYALLISDKLPINICGGFHVFIHAQPVESPYSEGEIKVGESYVRITEWLNALQKEWTD
jgi:hypothetical protein